MLLGVVCRRPDPRSSVPVPAVPAVAPGSRKRGRLRLPAKRGLPLALAFHSQSEIRNAFPGPRYRRNDGGRWRQGPVKCSGQGAVLERAGLMAGPSREGQGGRPRRASHGRSRDRGVPPSGAGSAVPRRQPAIGQEGERGCPRRAPVGRGAAGPGRPDSTARNNAPCGRLQE